MLVALWLALHFFILLCWVGLVRKHGLRWVYDLAISPFRWVWRVPICAVCAWLAPLTRQFFPPVPVSCVLAALLLVAAPAHAQFNPCGDVNYGPDWNLDGNSNYNGDDGSARSYKNKDGSPNPCAYYQVTNNYQWIVGPFFKTVLPWLLGILAVWSLPWLLKRLLARHTTGY